MSNATLTVDLNKFRRNLAICKKQTDARMLLVVKANAYGHGITKISQIAIEEGVHVLGVANTDELTVLRNAGLNAEIFLLGVVDPEDFPTAVKFKAHVPVWRLDQLESLDAAAAKQGMTGKFQIKIDTGMGRLGLFIEELGDFLRHIQKFKNIQCTGVYSHFMGSDLDDLTHAGAQLDLFTKAVTQIRTSGLTPEYIHIANSPATLRMSASHFNLVRLGVAAYGLNPFLPTPNVVALEPIASWTTKLLNIKTLPPGHGVSYGAEYRTSENQRIGVVPVGYADGFRRYPSKINTVLIRGQEVRVLGRVCMDHIMVDLSSVAGAALNDEVVLIGRQGDKEISADILSVRWGTNNYDVVVNIGNRVKRIYKD